MGVHGGEGLGEAPDLRGSRARPRRFVFTFSALVMVIGLLAFSAGMAGATPGKQTSAADQYESVVVVKAAVSKSKPKPPSGSAPASTAVVKSSTLPFTGISLGGVVVIGAGLVGLGMMLRRRQQDDKI